MNGVEEDGVIKPGTLTNSAEIHNFGKITNAQRSEFENTYYLYNNGNIENDGSFTTGSMYNGTYDGGSVHSGAGIIKNSGSFTLNSGATLYNHADGEINNTGSFKIDGAVDSPTTLENMGTVTTTSAFVPGDNRTNSIVNTGVEISGIGDGILENTSNFPHIIYLNNVEGSTAPASISYTFSATGANPSSPTKEGYAFGGWYTDSVCTIEYNGYFGDSSGNLSFSSNAGGDGIQTALIGNLWAKWTSAD